MLACRHKWSSKSNDLIMSCPDTSENKHAESVALLAATMFLWKWREDHMAVPSRAGHEFLQCVCVYFHSILFHYCKAWGEPLQSHDLQLEVRHQSTAQ